MSIPGRDWLLALAERLVEVDGVVGVVLGGSRARGTHTVKSDIDLGLYYEPPLDLDALARLARDVAGPEAEVSEPGAWGPWVDGGAWLRIAGRPVDWIYRDLGRVERSVADARAGVVAWHHQAGHPLGVPSFQYAAELAVGIVLADPSGRLAAGKDRLAGYPPALAAAIDRSCSWEARFALQIARKAVSRADIAYVSGCLFRAMLLLAHIVHARAGVWLTNEKGAVAAADTLLEAPPGFAAHVGTVFAALGPAPAQLTAAIDAAAALCAQVCLPPPPILSGR